MHCWHKAQPRLDLNGWLYEDCAQEHCAIDFLAFVCALCQQLLVMQNRVCLGRREPNCPYGSKLSKRFQCLFPSDD